MVKHTLKNKFLRKGDMPVLYLLSLKPKPTLLHHALGCQGGSLESATPRPPC